MTRPAIPLAPFNERAATFLSIHRGSAVLPFIPNLDIDVTALEACDAVLPVTINRGAPGTAWIASPVTTYCDYAIEEMDRLGHRLLTTPLRWTAQAFGCWMRRAGIDHAVSVNNWLITTNAYPDASQAQIGGIVVAAKRQWRNRAIWFRSLNGVHNPGWIDAMRAAGCMLIPSRQVYLFDDIHALARQRTDLKRDLSLLARSALRRYDAGELDDADYARIADLYADLYIRKYSAFNPQYQAAFIKAWHRSGLLTIDAVRDGDGLLQGAVGTVCFGNVITSPIVGYNTQLPLQSGLYRILAATVLRQGMEHHCLVNLSAGVAHFKRQRGGQPAIEYSAVVTDHLSRAQRAVLSTLRRIADGIGVPIMQRYQL